MRYFYHFLHPTYSFELYAAVKSASQRQSYLSSKNIYGIGVRSLMAPLMTPLDNFTRVQKELKKMKRMTVVVPVRDDLYDDYNRALACFLKHFQEIDAEEDFDELVLLFNHLIFTSGYAAEIDEFKKTFFETRKALKLD